MKLTSTGEEKGWPLRGAVLVSFSLSGQRSDYQDYVTPPLAQRLAIVAGQGGKGHDRAELSSYCYFLLLALTAPAPLPELIFSCGGVMRSSVRSGITLIRLKI